MGIPVATIIALQTARRAAAMNAVRRNQKAAEERKKREAEQKKNDDIVRVVALLRKDPEFFEIVSLLGELPSEQYASIKSLILALAHK